jgi:transposase-like protein
MAKKRRSREEWRRVIRQWRASGVSQEQFATRLGVARSTLSWWCWEIGREDDGDLGPGDEVAFVPVEVAAQAPTDGAANSPVAVVEVGRARIRIAAGTDPRWVAALVAELGAC